MSRVAKMGVAVPDGVEVAIADGIVTVKGKGGELSRTVHHLVRVGNDGGSLSFQPVNNTRQANALSGTMCKLVANMVEGVSKGFEKKLTLVGVGFRARAEGSKLNLSVGYSHPVELDLPEGIQAETPTPTEIIIKGADREAVGQFAANVRSTRPPEPYKGKGIRYADERVVMKETKKK